MRFGDALFGAGDLGGVARDEVEHGLLGVKLRDRWKDTTSVAGEKNDVAGVVIGDAGNESVLDVFNGVGAVNGQ